MTRPDMSDRGSTADGSSVPTSSASSAAISTVTELRQHAASFVEARHFCKDQACSGGLMEAMETGWRVSSMQAYRRRFGVPAESVWDPYYNKRSKTGGARVRDEAVQVKIHEQKKETAGGKCDEILWPDLDNDLVCGSCKVLVGNFSSKYQTCEHYCSYISRTCVAAFEEVDDDCAESFPIACDQLFKSSDAICQCSENPLIVAELGSAAWLRSFVICLTATTLIEGSDVVWFLPFVASEHGRRFVPLYVCSKQILALVCWVVARMVEELEQQHQSAHFTRLLLLTSGALLGIYSALLFAEWARAGPQPAGPLLVGEDASISAVPDMASSEHTKRQDLPVWKFLTVTTICNLDGLGVYVVPLSTGTFTGPQLALSFLLVGFFVAGSCMCVTQLRFVEWAVGVVPFWFIIACLSLWSLAQAARLY